MTGEWQPRTERAPKNPRHLLKRNDTSRLDGHLKSSREQNSRIIPSSRAFGKMLLHDQREWRRMTPLPSGAPTP